MLVYLNYISTYWDGEGTFRRFQAIEDQMKRNESSSDESQVTDAMKESITRIIDMMRQRERKNKAHRPRVWVRNLYR